jgi:protein SCO1/2
MVSRQLREGAPTLQAGTALPAPRPIAAFLLTDHTGASFSNAQLRGTPSLLFFGFTHCPDVCPTTLALMAQLNRDNDLKTLHMLFITVDPGRDDQQTLQRYVQAFGGGLTGLRGPDAVLDPLLLNVGAARLIQPMVGSDYTVDHSATLFYINAEGQLSAVFTPPFDLPRLRADLLALMNSNY